jgi:hypothetical protein
MINTINYAFKSSELKKNGQKSDQHTATEFW